jgi:hypothetical protein
MNDLVMREFLDFAEAGFEFEPAAPPTSADTGPARLLAVASELSHARSLPVAAILRSFGAVLFRRLAVLYPIFFVDTDSAFEFLSNARDLAALLSDAGVAAIECRQPQPARLEIVVRSDYPLADLGAGLIEGCGEYYREGIRLDRRYLLATKGQAVVFVVTRIAAALPLAPDLEHARAGKIL